MPKHAAILAALTLAGAVSGCSGAGETGDMLLRGTAQQPTAMDLSRFQADVDCPPAQIRTGTETLAIAEPGKQADPNALRFQGSIGQVVRECRAAGEQITIRVGTAGRVLSGPKGATGSGDLPLRVAVLAGDKVLYSQLHRVPFTVSAPDYGVTWTKVVEDIAVPAAAVVEGARIEVGFDELGLKQRPDRPRVPRG